ncbi:hypothetical protein HY837_05465 [archaeon]|nr:hypothetical protein [archaeon]
MGWLNNLFRKREVLKFASLKDLEKYFAEFVRPVVEQTNKTKGKLHEEVKYKIHEVKGEIEKLRNAELRNPNIEEKLKDYMTGNRSNYVSQLNFFINNLPNFNEQFCEKFNENLTLFAEKTRKNNLILREFFAHEVRDVSEKITELTKTVENIKTEEKKVEKSNRILKNIKEYHDKTSMLNNSRQKNIETEIIAHEKEIKEEKQEKDKIEKSEEYKKHLELLAEEEHKLEELREVKERILNFIASIFRVLKKYERVAVKHQGLIHGYLKSTVDTFLLDKDNKIIEILEKASNIELNEKDKTKLDKSLVNFNETQLNKLRKECFEREKTHNNVSKKVKEEKINQKLKDLNEDIKKKGVKLEEFKKEQEENNSLQERLDKEMKELLEEIKRAVEEYCYAKISISE